MTGRIPRAEDGASPGAPFRLRARPRRRGREQRTETPRRAVRGRRAALVRGRLTGAARPRRQRDVRRRAASVAAAVAAPARDGRGGPAQRLPQRPVGPAPAHRRLPRRHHLRPGDGGRTRGRTGEGGARPGDGRGCRRAAVRGQRSAPAAVGALAEVDSFLAAYQRHGARRLSADEADRYVREIAVVARALGVPAPPESVQRCATSSRRTVPSWRARPRRARRPATSCCSRRCTRRCARCTACSHRRRWRCSRAGRGGRSETAVPAGGRGPRRPPRRRGARPRPPLGDDADPAEHVHVVSDTT
jgi:hypothetical protein